MPKLAVGKVQFNTAIDGSLVDEWKAWVETQPGGLTRDQHLEMAMRRHMASPPPLPYVPPLTDTDEKPRKAKGKR